MPGHFIGHFFIVKILTKNVDFVTFSGILETFVEHFVGNLQALTPKCQKIHLIFFFIICPEVTVSEVMTVSCRVHCDQRSKNVFLDR